MDSCTSTSIMVLSVLRAYWMYYTKCIMYACVCAFACLVVLMYYSLIFFILCSAGVFFMLIASSRPFAALGEDDS